MTFLFLSINVLMSRYMNIFDTLDKNLIIVRNDLHSMNSAVELLIDYICEYTNINLNKYHLVRKIFNRDETQINEYNMGISLFQHEDQSIKKDITAILLLTNSLLDKESSKIIILMLGQNANNFIEIQNKFKKINSSTNSYNQIDELKDIESIYRFFIR